MPNRRAKLHPWQVFHAANKTLSPGVIAKIFGKANVRTAYLYGQDPDFTEQRCKNPLEAIHLMLRQLDLVGRGDVAHCAIAYLQTALEDDYLPAVKDLQPTMADEILQDYSAVGRLQELINDGAGLDDVEQAGKAAVEEINRTVAKYRQELGQ